VKALGSLVFLLLALDCLRVARTTRLEGWRPLMAARCRSLLRIWRSSLFSGGAR